MTIFGLIIMTRQSYRAERKECAKIVLDTQGLVRAAEADRDAANRQIERLLHNSVELTLLWAAVRECGVDSRVRVVYKRLSPKAKG